MESAAILVIFICFMHAFASCDSL